MNTGRARTTAAMATTGQRQEGVLQRYLDNLARNQQRRNHLEPDNLEQNRKQRHAMDVRLFVASLPRAPTDYLRRLEDEIDRSCPMCFHSYDMGTLPIGSSTSTASTQRIAQRQNGGWRSSQRVLYNSPSVAFRSIIRAIDGRSTVQEKTSWKEVKGNIETPVILPCNHIVGAKCISKWFENADTCPMCRAQLVIHSSRVLQRHSDTISYFPILLQRLFLLISGLMTSAAQ